MTERSHVVAMRVDRGFATLVVTRTVENKGPVSDQAFFHLDMPPGAVATRLRTSSAANGTTSWFEGELMEAEAAAAKYKELTGIGGMYPKDPALLSWRSQGELALQVFPVPKQSTKTIEYTLKVPLTYEYGAYHATLPVLGTDDLAATVRATPARAEDALTINGVSAVGGAPIVASAASGLDIVLVPRRTAPVETALSSTVLAHDRHLVHAQLNAAPHIMEAPHGARVVVLFDSSRSHHNADSALAGVRAYLESMPDAVVDFLAFDRAVHAPIGRGLPVATALAKLATYHPALGNGSGLDAALREADHVLTTSQAQVKRVVVVTDTLTRSDLTPEKVGALTWQSGALVHIAIVSTGTGFVKRDDESPWATLPRRTGGLFWNATSSRIVDHESRVAFEELARPKRLDNVTLTGLSGLQSPPAQIDEGTGFDHFMVADTATSRVDLSGELWSKPFRLTITPTAEQAKLDAALVFGSTLLADLSESEETKLAMLGRAVSPVTSYLAIEPGVRPSTEGLDWEGGGGGGGGIGLGNVGMIGHGNGGGARTAVVNDMWLKAAVTAALKKCAPGALGVEVKLETTLDEVVDVTNVTTLPLRDAKGEACVREEVWGLGLPASFDDRFLERAVSITL